MHSIDLNLLTALDALLDEGSVLGAARRMNLSAPAMSRTLGRIRRGLSEFDAPERNLTEPRALELHGRVRSVIEDARLVMRPEGLADPATLVRGFTVRASDYVAGVFGAALQAIAAREAPHVTLRFADQGKEDVTALREGRIDHRHWRTRQYRAGNSHADAVARPLRRGGAQGPSTVEGQNERAALRSGRARQRLKAWPESRSD